MQARNFAALAGCTLLLAGLSGPVSAQGSIDNPVTFTVTDGTGTVLNDAELISRSSAGLHKLSAIAAGKFVLDAAENSKLSLEVFDGNGNSTTVSAIVPPMTKPDALIVWDGNDVLVRFNDLAVGPKGPQQTVGTLTAAIPPATAVGGGNDLCGSADAIGGDGAFAFSNAGAGTDGGATCSFSWQADVWFAWTADTDGGATIDTCGSSGDTIMAVFDACAGTELACNDDDCGLQSSVTFPVSNGTTYLVGIAGFFGASVSGNLNVTQFASSGGGSNECATAQVIAGYGIFGFDNSIATTDGPLECENAGQSEIDFDVWFSWDAPSTDLVQWQTCNGLAAGIDTKLAVYLACPAGQGEAIACDDDGCSNAAPFDSQLTFNATAGTTYLLRLGTFAGGPGGVGEHELSVAPPPPSCASGVGCQDPITANATSSDTGFGFVSAENFNSPTGGTITDICWWGVYLDGNFCGGQTDGFTVTYYADNGSGTAPGAVKAGPFAVSVTRSETGNIVAGLAPEIQYEASHPPVSVNAGECCWIEILNDVGGGGCGWFWSWAASGDLRFALDGAPALGNDLAFCVDVEIEPDGCPLVGSSNDLCDNADPISGDGAFGFDNTVANTDGAPDPLCYAFGSSQVDSDVWFCWTATCDGNVELNTCGQTAVDTKVAVYDGCAPGPILACNDDSCGLQSSVSWAATAGNSYKIRVGTFPGAAGGTGTFTITEFGCIAPITNDDCDDAIAVNVPDTVDGSTIGATPEAGIPTGGNCTDEFGNEYDGDEPGVWYTLVGTGTTVTVSMCSNDSYDGRLMVLCGPCDALECVATNDDGCSSFGTSEVSFCAVSGVTYRVLVHGFSGTDVGNFTLDISEDGVGCTSTKCATVGACCIDEACIVTTEDDCANLGGIYQGDDTDCGSLDGYVSAAGGTGFEDISGTGTQHALGDDAFAEVPIGFGFSFYGNNQAVVKVSSNGYLTFGPDGTDFSNDCIPDTFDPNDYIGPLWDDYNPSLGGLVTTETVGTAPNRRFIAQWTNIQFFGGGGDNTFQAKLYEGSNDIEFCYGAQDGASATIGIENPDGTDGLELSCNGTASPADGDCNTISPIITGFPCGAECHMIMGEAGNGAVFESDQVSYDSNNIYLANVDYDRLITMIDTPALSVARTLRMYSDYNGNARGPLRFLYEVDANPEPDFAVQVLMSNPIDFPHFPLQYSSALNVYTLPDGTMYTETVGQQVGGVELSPELVFDVDSEGNPTWTIAFTVDFNF